MEVQCLPAVYRSCEEASDLGDFLDSVDSDVLEEEPPLLPGLKLLRLPLETQHAGKRQILGIPLEVLGQEGPVSPAAGPEHDLCLSLAVFLSRVEEYINNDVLVVALAKVYSLHIY